MIITYFSRIYFLSRLIFLRIRSRWQYGPDKISVWLLKDFLLRKVLLFYPFNLSLCNFGQRQHNFCCTDPTDPNFRHIKIITTLPSSICNICLLFVFLLMRSFSFNSKKSNLQVNEGCTALFLFWIDKSNIAQVSLRRWSIFSFLDMPTLKLRIIIILLIDRPEVILLNARTTKNYVSFA